MADLHIVREHALGLSKARKIAFQWAEQAENEFAMQCSYTEGETSDEVVFARAGVKGHLLVTSAQFELRAQLGFLLGAFKPVIEAEIVKNLDALLLAQAASHAAKPKRAKSSKAG